MNLRVDEVGGDLLIRVEDERIDAAGAVQFRDAMRNAAAGDHRRLVLDLSRVGFIDSSGLGAIVAARKHIGGDRNLELAGLAPVVAKVFRLTRLDEVFTIHSDASTAFGGHVHAG